MVTNTHTQKHCVMRCSGRKLTTLCFTFYNIRIVFASSFVSFSLLCSFCCHSPFSFLNFSSFLAFSMQIDACKCVKKNVPVIIKHTKSAVVQITRPLVKFGRNGWMLHIYILLSYCLNLSLHLICSSWRHTTQCWLLNKWNLAYGRPIWCKMGAPCILWRACGWDDTIEIGINIARTPSSRWGLWAACVIFDLSHFIMLNEFQLLITFDCRITQSPSNHILPPYTIPTHLFKMFAANAIILSIQSQI